MLVFNAGEALAGLLVSLAHVVVRGLMTADLVPELCTHFGVMENEVHCLESSCNFIINSL